MSRRLRAYAVDVLIAAGFLILPLLLFGSVTLGSRTMLPVDNLFQWQPWSAAAEAKGIIYPHNGLLSDLILENYPWKQFIVESIRAGEIPLWNPNIFSGTPFLATGQHSAYYPFSMLFMALPLAKAYGWFTLSQLWLAGVFTYVFGRILGMRRTSAAAAGLIFQGSGFLLVSSAVFPMILAAAIWLPLLLACVEKIVRNATDESQAGRTLPWVVLGSVALGTQILAGHIEITYYTLLVMGAYALWRLVSRALAWRRNSDAEGDQQDGRPGWARVLLKPAGWLAGMAALGILLGAIQFVPFVEVGQANFREGSASLAEIRGWAFPARRILTLAMPDFYGNPADHDYFDLFDFEQVGFERNYQGELNPHGPYTSNWGIKNYVEGGIYLGLLSTVLAFLGVYSAWRIHRKRRSEIGFFSILSLLSLTFIFGMPTYALLYYGLPGINQLHSPFRWVFPLSIGVAVLAGYGMDYLATTRAQLIGHGPASRQAADRSKLESIVLLNGPRSLVSWLAALMFWAGIGLATGLLISRLIFPSIESMVEGLFLGLARAPDAFPDARAFYSYELEQALVLAVMLTAGGLVLRISRSAATLFGRPLWTLLALGLIIVDLFIAGYGFNAAADPDLLQHKPELISWLEQQPGDWRLTTFTPHGDKPLNANTPWLYDLQDIRGYDSVILKQYTDYMAAIEPQDELQFNRVQPLMNWESINSPLLDLLGVKYIITSEAITLPKLEEVWQGEGLLVYENLAVAPRAYTISRGATAVVPDPLAAMERLDPRQYVLLEDDGWTGEAPTRAEPGSMAAAEIVNYGNIEVTVQATVDEPSWLILNDTYFQGWDAYVQPLDPPGDEQSVEVHLVNGNFRGVELEPGSWQVRFRYSPLTFKVGGLASFMGAIIILFALVVWLWRRIYDPQAPLTNTRSIAKNSVAPMTLNLFNRAIDFVFAAFYLRILGPSDAGAYATAIIIAGWFEIISNWGLNTLIIREVSKDKSQASRYLLNTSILRIATSLIAAVPIFIYMAIANQSDNPLDPATTAAILLLMVGMIFSGLGQGFTGLFYAFEQAELPAAITTVTTILKVGLGMLVLLIGAGFVGLAGISIIVNLVTLVILVAAAFRQFPLTAPWRVDFGLQRRMLVLSYPLMLNHLFAVIFFQIDVPMMRQINGEEAVGWYNSAYKWVNAFNVIPSFFTFALFPVISRQIQSAESDARRTFRMS
ncbi:MAG: oligosaccharide flippase family protein, partial [Chloroflexota bacterium]